jgi:putative heme iron utilization protein
MPAESSHLILPKSSVVAVDVIDVDSVDDTVVDWDDVTDVVMVEDTDVVCDVVNEEVAVLETLDVADVD